MTKRSNPKISTLNLLRNDSSVNILADDVSFSNDATPTRRAFALIDNDYNENFNSIIHTGEGSPENKMIRINSSLMQPSYSTILLSKLSKNN